MTIKVTVIEDVSTISVSGNTTSINLTGEPTEISVVNPATSVTFNPSQSFSSTNVQDALFEAHEMIGQQSNNYSIQLSDANKFEISSGNAFFRMYAAGSQFGWDTSLISSDDLKLVSHGTNTSAIFKDTSIEFHDPVYMTGNVPLGEDYRLGYITTDSPYTSARHHYVLKNNDEKVGYIGAVGTGNTAKVFIGEGSSAIAVRGIPFVGAEVTPVSLQGNDQDANTDLGTSTARFRDLYLSDNLYADGVSFEDANITFTTDQLVVNNAGGNSLITTTSQGVNLKYNGVQKLATTSTGIDVTGTLTSDGLTVEAGIAQLELIDTGVSGSTKLRTANAQTWLEIDPDNVQASSGFKTYIDGKQFFQITDVGDISFYEDTGTTPKFFWDASAERLGIGTSSPAHALDVIGNINIKGTVPTLLFTDTDSNPDFNIIGGGSLSFRDETNSATRMLIDSSGNVGIGTTSPTGDLTIGRNGNASGGNIMLGRTTNATNKYAVITSQAYNSSTDTEGFTAIATQGISGTNLVTIGGGIGEVDSATQLRFYTSSATGTRTGSERMRIDSSGNVGIGTSSPTQALDVNGTAAMDGLTVENTSGSTTALIRAAGGGNNSATLDLTSRGSGNQYRNTEIVSVGENSPTAKLQFKLDNSSGNLIKALEIDGNGDISFYEDTGTTPKFFWDASTERLGIGTNSPSAVLETFGGTSFIGAKFKGYTTGKTALVGTDNNSAWFGLDDGTYGLTNSIQLFGTDNSIQFDTNGSERMRIDSSGNLLVATTDQYAFNGGFTVQTGTVPYINVGHASTVASGNYYAAFRHGNNTIGTITQSNTTGVNYNVSSDERLKENITDSADAGSKVDSIQIRQYDWKADGSHQDYGVIAQELVEVAPEAVHQPVDEEDMMGVDYSKLVPMLIKEVQTLRNRVAQLENN